MLKENKYLRFLCNACSYLLSQYLLKFSSIACRHSCCISKLWMVSASKRSVIRVWLSHIFSNKTSTSLPAGKKYSFISPMVYTIFDSGSTISYFPVISKPKLPSFASILEMSNHPTWRSFVDLGQHRSSDAKHRFVIWVGLFRYSRTFSSGALMVVETVSLTTSPSQSSFNNSRALGRIALNISTHSSGILVISTSSLVASPPILVKV